MPVAILAQPLKLTGKRCILSNITNDNQSLTINLLDVDDTQILSFPAFKGKRKYEDAITTGDFYLFWIGLPEKDQKIYTADLQSRVTLLNGLNLDTSEKIMSSIVTGDETSKLSNTLVTDSVKSIIYSLLIEDEQEIDLLIVNYEGKAIRNIAIIADADCIKMVPLAFTSWQSILNAIPERKKDVKKIINAIAHSNIGWRIRKIENAHIFNEAKSLLNEIREGLLQSQNLEMPIDSYQGRIQQLINSLVRFGFEETQQIHTALEAGSRVLTQAMTIFLDGKDITDRVISGTVNLYGNTVLSDCNLELKTEEVLTGSEIEIHLEGLTYRFLVEEDSFNAKDRSLSLWGRSLSARLFEPLAIRKKWQFSNTMASHIAQTVCGGFSLNWQIDDWLVPFYEREAYPLDVVNELAVSAGAVVRAIPDGVIHVVYPYFDEYPELILDAILALTKEKRIRQADGVRVVYGDKESAFVTLESDRAIVRPGEWAEVKVYTLCDYTMSCSADVYYKAREDVVEEVEEELVIEKGNTGSLSKPVVEVISVSDPQAKVVGQKVICPECTCRLITIKYKTRYDLWKLTNHTESKALFCAVETRNSYTILSGTGERIVEVEAPLINDSYLARRRAEKELTDKQGFWHLKVTIPFEELTCNPLGLCVSTPYGRGVVVGNTISFTAKPLKIVNQLEVLLWQQ